jgi:hypothetical protein
MRRKERTLIDVDTLTKSRTEIDEPNFTIP